MSKIKEVETCSRFISEIVQFVLPIEQRFVLVDHTAFSEEFVITIGFDKRLSIRSMNLFVILSKKFRIVTCIDIIGLFICHCVRTLKRQTVAFSMLWLLLFSFEEKMLLSSLVNKFKEKCTIDNKIVTGLKKDDFLVYICCLQEHMDVEKEKKTFYKFIP